MRKLESGATKAENGERRPGISRLRTLAALVGGLALVLLVPVLAAGKGARAVDRESLTGGAEGFELLLEKPLSLAVLSDDDLETLWKVWEPEERERAEAASVDDRRRMVFDRYGLVPRPDDPSLPLGYTSDGNGRLAPNCLSCHGGRVAGQVIIGIGNTYQDVQGLLDDLAALRALRAGREPASGARGATFGFPMNFFKGLTNATQYSILLGAMRDENLDQRFPPEQTQEYVHNDIDAPAWWQFKKKERIYWDAMAPKSTRTLMQFTMAPGLSGETIRSWEPEFEKIKEAIEQLEAPSYPFEIDTELAKRGQVAFEATCSECHGTYGESPSYPNRVVPLTLLKTDPVRARAITRESRKLYNQSWFSNYGEHPVQLSSRGYLAPPLDGVWATAPYLHNGSLPTLRHVLFPDERPAVWRRPDTIDAGGIEGYDQDRVGLVVEELQQVPAGLSPRLERTYYDTSASSHSNGGHLFPEKLSRDQRLAVLEYLKTL